MERGYYFDTEAAQVECTDTSRIIAIFEFPSIIRESSLKVMLDKARTEFHPQQT